MTYDLDTLARRFFDIAHEGAHLRSLAERMRSGLLDDLAGTNPRSIVTITHSALAAATAEWIAAEHTPLPMPVLVTTELPAYVGPLDVVVIAADTRDVSVERELHSIAMAADRRGCFTIFVGDPEVADELPERIRVVLNLPGVEAALPARLAGTLIGVCAASTNRIDCGIDQLDMLANAIDEELLSLSPERDPLVNPAAQLMEWSTQARVVHTARRPAELALARVIANFWSASGTICASLPFDQVVSAFERSGAAQRDIFYDPFDEDSEAVLPLKFVVWGEAEFPLGPASPQLSSPDAQPGLEESFRLLMRGLSATVFVA